MKNTLTLFDYNFKIIETNKNFFVCEFEKNGKTELIHINREKFEDILLFFRSINKASRIQIVKKSDGFSTFHLISSTGQIVLEENRLTKEVNTEISQPLYIAIPQKEISILTIEKIQNASGELMEALGFEIEQKEEPILGSFFQKSWWKKKFGLLGSESGDVYNQAKKALILQHQNLPNAEATEKLANAAANFMTAIKDVDTVAARFGGLIVVKYNINGKSGVICETLSPDLTILFENNPQLLSNPNGVFQLFENLKNNPNHFKELTRPAQSE